MKLPTAAELRGISWLGEATEVALIVVCPSRSRAAGYSDKMNSDLAFFYIAGKKKNKKKKNNMKCANCGKEIRDGDYIHVSTPNKKDIYLHSMPCEWYEKTNENAAH